MKLSDLIALFLCITTNNVFAQNEYPTEYEVQYEVAFSLDSTNLENRAIETLYLFTGPKYGVFMSYKEAFKEEIRANLEHQLKTTGELKISKEMTSSFPKLFYKDHQNSQVWTQEKIDRKLYSYQEPNIPLEWKIEEDSKEIMGYAAQKATTHFAGRDYIAWFTLEVPIPDGPYLFSGLPGLIIELYDTEDHYHFTLKSMSKMEEVRVFEFANSEDIAKTDFLELKEKALKNRDHTIFNQGNIQISLSTSPQMSQESKMKNQELKRKIKENQARKNNLIERL